MNICKVIFPKYSFREKADIRFQPVLCEFVSGEALLYMGRNYRLDLQLDLALRKSVVTLTKGIFFIQTKSAEQDYLRPYMIDWYKQKCSHKIQKRVETITPSSSMSSPKKSR